MDARSIEKTLIPARRGDDLEGGLCTARCGIVVRWVGLAVLIIAMMPALIASGQLENV
jgi:hypothetical protein